MRIFLNYLPWPSSVDWGGWVCWEREKLHAWREERLEEYWVCVNLPQCGAVKWACFWPASSRMCIKSTIFFQHEHGLHAKMLRFRRLSQLALEHEDIQKKELPEAQVSSCYWPGGTHRWSVKGKHPCAAFIFSPSRRVLWRSCTRLSA